MDLRAGGGNVGAGLSARTGAFAKDNPATTYGSQVAFLQKTGEIGQTVAGFPAGAVRVGILCAQRISSGVMNNQTIELLVDGVAIGTVTPSADGNFAAMAFPAVTLAAGSHAILFRGVPPAGDHTALIDNVTFTAVPSTAPTPTPTPPPEPTTRAIGAARLRRLAARAS